MGTYPDASAALFIDSSSVIVLHFRGLRLQDLAQSNVDEKFLTVASFVVCRSGVGRHHMTIRPQQRASSEKEMPRTAARVDESTALTLWQPEW
jgi:hypothetical protein